MEQQAVRQDLLIIANMVKTQSKVLDIGCGEGELLHYLWQHKHIDGRGIEISQQGVSRAVQKGLSVIQGDADTDLTFYPDSSFDYVISSQVIQATQFPKEVVRQMLRIGKKVIISLPNFGYWRNRWYLMRNGKMPVTETLSYEWYETPNIHFCTIKDFTLLCESLECRILRSVFIGKEDKLLKDSIYGLFPNMFAEQAIFLLETKKG